jgi:hypothetical protein
VEHARRVGGAAQSASARAVFDAAHAAAAPAGPRLAHDPLARHRAEPDRVERSSRLRDRETGDPFVCGPGRRPRPAAASLPWPRMSLSRCSRGRSRGARGGGDVRGSWCLPRPFRQGEDGRRRQSAAKRSVHLLLRSPPTNASRSRLSRSLWAVALSRRWGGLVGGGLIRRDLLARVPSRRRLRRGGGIRVSAPWAARFFRPGEPPRRRPILASGRRGVFRRRRSLFAFARACAPGIHAKRESSKGLSAVAAVARRAVGLGPAVSSCARPGDASGRLRFAARPGCGCAVSRAASSPSGSCGASASSVGAAAGSLERWAGAETQHRPMLCKSTGSMPRSVRPRAPCAPRPAFHVHPARRRSPAKARSAALAG